MSTPRALIILWFAASAALADPPRGAGEAPQLNLEQALARARAWTKEKKIDTSRQYLEAVAFDRRGASSSGFGHCWEVRWQVPNAKGGTTFVYVCEGDRIEIRLGE